MLVLIPVLSFFFFSLVWPDRLLGAGLILVVSTKSRSGTFLMSKLFRGSQENLGKMVNAHFSTRKNRGTRLKKFLTIFMFPSKLELKQWVQYFIAITTVSMEYLERTTVNCCLEMWSIVAALAWLHRAILCQKCARPNISEYCRSGHMKLALSH